MTKVKWAAGYQNLQHKIHLNADAILTGTLIAIDPASFSSSVPGYAIFRSGELEFAGTIPKPKHKDINRRVQYLYDEIAALVPVPPDVLAIEEIHKSIAHASLLWAVGVSVAAARAPVMLEIPLNVWKSLAKATPEYAKDDVNDAVMIGKTVILLAREYKEKQERGAS
jgi:Holliday junction resolvasome RuvABC endonuclease subunit